MTYSDVDNAVPDFFDKNMAKPSWHKSIMKLGPPSIELESIIRLSTEVEGTLV
jgi:hypothetical protein